MKMLHHASNLEVTHVLTPDILYCNWLGPQTPQSVRQSGAVILTIQQEHGFRKILNDNTHVVGPWHLAARWTAEEWFPAMIQAGLWYFAWILPDNIFAELSALRALPASEVVTTFRSYHDAQAWLNAK